ncbi:MAG: RNA 2',3'-cyclic phosphodiesterase [Candidatus Dormiibacterota bacterium]
MGAGQLEEEGPLTQRLFFGLPVPEEQGHELAAYLSVCAEKAPEFRWTPPTNLHLTLRFIGSVEVSVAEAIAGILATVPLGGFDIELGGLGTFKRGRLARVLWLGMRAGADKAIELAAQVDAECVKAGLAADARAFQPHLTLARSRRREGAVFPALPPPPTLRPWRADELILYRSRLGRPAAVYTALRSLRLS